MEGSTIREGKYKDNIRRAADWLMNHCQPNGMIGKRQLRVTLRISTKPACH
jgi:hypothetical protein